MLVLGLHRWIRWNCRKEATRTKLKNIECLGTNANDKKLIQTLISSYENTGNRLNKKWKHSNEKGWKKEQENMMKTFWDDNTIWKFEINRIGSFGDAIASTLLEFWNVLCGRTCLSYVATWKVSRAETIVLI